MALHISINSKSKPSSCDDPIYQGFYSELQIIGSDVAMLKDIEDFCYKLKKGMSIKSGDLAYKPFQEMFLNAYTPKVERYFKEYTKRAYKKQRERKPSSNKQDNIKDWAYKYPTIKECGLEDTGPAILDFNILARMKRDCDDLHLIEYGSKKILAELDAPAKTTSNT